MLEDKYNQKFLAMQGLMIMELVLLNMAEGK